MAKVKCRECGFVSARDWDTRQFTEMDDKKRSTGKIGTMYAGFEPMQVCFINSFNIREEVEILRKAAHDEPKQNSIGEMIYPDLSIHVNAVLNTERVCKPFRKWQQGFTPKEHKEIVNKEHERKWRLFEVGLIVLGNIIAGCLGAYLVWLVSNQSIKPPV